MAKKKSQALNIETTLQLFKQNFKFSSAHFLIFDEKHAEMLHGHNYQVQIQVGFIPTPEIAEKGFLVDFKILKDLVKARVDEWDEHVLLPEENPELKFGISGPSMEVKFRERFYVFPKNEVILLPITNTSVENLSQLLAQILFEDFRSFDLKTLQVRVEETQGQAATSSISI